MALLLSTTAENTVLIRGQHKAAMLRLLGDNLGEQPGTSHT